LVESISSKTINSRKELVSLLTVAKGLPILRYLQYERSSGHLGCSIARRNAAMLPCMVVGNGEGGEKGRRRRQRMVLVIWSVGGEGRRMGRRGRFIYIILLRAFQG
jgi:hypothetical protein